MIFSKNSAVMQLLESADEIELIFRGINIPNRLGNHRSVYYGIQDLDKPHIIFMSSENLRKDIEEQVGCSVFSSNIWFNREKATKVIELYYLANGMMTHNDKIVVTGIIRLVNRSNGYPYFYILYRVESATA